MALETGRFYLSRCGEKIEILKTNVEILGNSPSTELGPESLGIIYVKGNKIKHTSWYDNGRYRLNEEDKNDIIADWVEPDLRYLPVFLTKPYPNYLNSMEDAIECAGMYTSSSNPLIGYAIVDVARKIILGSKPGQILEE